jgi:hypothetical protein
MAVWTVLDSCGIIIDQTAGPGFTTLHHAENSLVSVQWKVL